MKKNAKKISLIVSFTVSFLIITSSPNVLNSSAFLGESKTQFTLDSYDKSSWAWGITEVVSTESDGHSNSASMFVDSEGDIHVTWHDQSEILGAANDSDIFYKRWDASKTTWTTTELISTESTDHSNDPTIFVDTSLNIHIVWEDSTNYDSSGDDYDIFYRFKSALDTSWSAIKVVSNDSTLYSYNPVIAVDSKGDSHIAWYDATDYNGAGIDQDIFYKKYDRTNDTWSQTQVVSDVSDAHSQHPSITIDLDDNVHFAWADQSTYAASGTDWDIFYKRWVHSTSVWGPTDVVSDNGEDSKIPIVDTDSLGNVFIIWEDASDYLGSGTDPDVFYRQWSVSMSTWELTQVVTLDSTDDARNPYIYVDSDDGIHCVWQDRTDLDGPGTDYDIFYKYRETTVSEWTDPAIVSTESTLLSDECSFGVDSKGVLHVIWDDITDYDFSGSDIDIFYNYFSGTPDKPDLAFIVPNPSDSADVSLDWNDVTRTNLYYVYRSTSYIWNVEDLIPIATVYASFYDDSLPAEDYYYYVIVAENNAGNSSHSNCQYVEYKIPHVREFTIISGLILGAMVVSLVIMKTRKNKSK